MSAEIRRLLLDAIHKLPFAGHADYVDGHSRVTLFKKDVIEVLEALLPPPGPDAPPAPSVTALVQQWREKASQHGAIYASGVLECADQLEAALKAAPLVRQEDEEDLSRVDQSRRSMPLELPRKPQREGSQRLPTTLELSGSEPDITDGLSTDDYMSTIRGRWDGIDWEKGFQRICEVAAENLERAEAAEAKLKADMKGICEDCGLVELVTVCARCASQRVEAVTRQALGAVSTEVCAVDPVDGIGQEGATRDTSSLSSTTYPVEQERQEEKPKDSWVCPNCRAWPMRLYADGVWACDECNHHLASPSLVSAPPRGEAQTEGHD